MDHSQRLELTLELTNGDLGGLSLCLPLLHLIVVQNCCHSVNIRSDICWVMTHEIKDDVGSARPASRRRKR